METIVLHHPITSVNLPETVLAVGYFDGVHLGHQEVIDKAKEIAEQKQLKSAVMTFEPHPSIVLSNKRDEIKLITPLSSKEKLMEQMEIDYFIVVRFTSSFADLAPAAFVRQYFIDLNVKHVVAGFDFTYGKYGKGTMETLSNNQNDNFGVTTVGKISDQESSNKISSTRIREAIHDGAMQISKELLGRYYETKGIVVHGEKRGRTIGFPTANISVHPDYIIPKVGVYTVELYVNNEWHWGICNVGYKPTFHDHSFEQTIEVHILQYNASIYGEEVILRWHDRLRDEQKFSGIEELKAQLEKDKQHALNYFNKISQ